MKKDTPRGFVFYSQDYFGEVLLRAFPMEARGIWVETLMLMDRSSRRGVLLKKTGDAYTFDELAKMFNDRKITPEVVAETYEALIKTGIADRDRISGQITSRKMVRDQKLRENGSKFGKKGGGNPILSTPATPTKHKADEDTFMGKDKGDPPPPLYTTDPDPDPDPDPDLGFPPLPDLSNTVKSPVPIVSPDAEKRAGRKPDPACALFVDRHRETLNTAYMAKRGDFVQLRELRRRNGVDASELPESWAVAVENYFGSPLPGWTLADLCVRFAVFRNSPLNEFRTPIHHVNGGNGHGPRSNESRAELNARTTREAGDRLRARYAAKAGGVGQQPDG